MKLIIAAVGWFAIDLYRGVRAAVDPAYRERRRYFDAGGAEYPFPYGGQE